MYNKKAISDALAKLNKAKAPKQEPDIIYSERGQWDHPGEVTRVPSSNITMQGVDTPLLGIDNLGNQQMMYPGAEYNFPGADYVDEYPIAKYGGLVTGLTNTKGNLLMNKKGKRMMAKSGSLSATNELFLGNPLVSKRKKSVFVPGHDFQKGGDSQKINKLKQEFADSLYNQFNNPSTRSRRLRKKVTPKDPLYKSLWNLSNRDGYEREVMENYQPSEIYYDPLNTDFTFPVFKDRYEIPKPVISNKVDRLPAKSIETPEISKEIIPSERATMDLKTYTDPWSGKQEVMNRSQHLQRQRAHYKGEEKPEVFERGFEDRISGRQALPEQIINYKQSRPQEYPEFNKNLSKMIGVIGMPKKSINSNLSLNDFQEGGVIELELTPEEIEQYKKEGYVVEEYQDGGKIISEHGWDYKKENDEYFTRKTGSDKWISPKGEALKAIQQKIFNDVDYTESDKKSDYINNVQQLISNGYTLEDLVKQRVGTKQGLLELFPQLADGSTTPVEKSPVTPKKDVNVVKEKPILDTRPSMLNLGLADYNRPKMFNTNIDEIKARAKADAIVNVEKENAILKRPTKMPYMPSWQDYAARINQGLTKPEYTEAELTDEEIAELQAQGHIVEEVTEPEPWLNSLQNNVSQQSIYNTDNVTLDPFGRKPKYGPTEEQMLKLQEFMKTPEEKGLKSWEPQTIRLKSWDETELGHATNELSKIFEKAEEVLAGISTEGLGNVIEQIQQGSSDPESLGEVKVLKEEEPVKETEPVYNIQDLDPFKFVGERNGEIIQTYTIPLINEPNTSVMYRNRGDESDIMGKKLAYTYAPFKPYKETLNKKYGSLSANDNSYVIALTADGIKGGKLKDFKDTDTPLSPTYVTKNVTELVIEPDNKYFDGIKQKGLGLRTSKDTVKYIPVGTSDSQSGSFKNWSGGHLLVENPKTKVMVVLHGRSDQLKEMFNKYLETEGIESANIYETDHKAYSLITNPKDGIHKGIKNRQLDNYNTERSGAGNFIYLQEINE